MYVYLNLFLNVISSVLLFRGKYRQENKKWFCRYKLCALYSRFSFRSEHFPRYRHHFFFNFQYDRICIQRSKSEWRALDVSTASIIQAWLLPYHGRSLVTAATLRIFQYLYTEYSTFFGMLLENLNNQYLFCCWVTFNIFAFNKRKHASTQAGRFSFNDALFYELATWHTLSYVVIWQTVNLPLMLCTQ